MDSYDLEVEFQKLISAMREKITEKEKAGTISANDAIDLHDLLTVRLANSRSAGWQRSSWCGEMQDDDDGWSRSGQAC